MERFNLFDGFAKKRLTEFSWPFSKGRDADWNMPSNQPRECEYVDARHKEMCEKFEASLKPMYDEHMAYYANRLRELEQTRIELDQAYADGSFSKRFMPSPSSKREQETVRERYAPRFSFKSVISSFFGSIFRRNKYSL